MTAQVDRWKLSFDGMNTDDLVESVTKLSSEWETQIRYSGEIELSSGMIYPLVIMNFLHDHPELSAVLDVGM